MNVNNSTTGAIFFQGVRHIRKLQKTSINLAANSSNRSLSRVSSIDSKVSSDEKLPAAKSSAIVKKQTIYIYPPDRNLSNSNSHSAKLLPSRDNSLSSLPKLPPAISSSKLTENSEFLTPQRQNSIKMPNNNTHNNPTPTQNNEPKVSTPLDKTRISVKRHSEKLEKEKENNNKAYLKRPKFILKQKEMFHYGDKLHDLIEKEKKEYIQKKSMQKNDNARESVMIKPFEKNPQNVSE